MYTIHLFIYQFVLVCINSNDKACLKLLSKLSFKQRDTHTHFQRNAHSENIHTHFHLYRWGLHW